MNNDLIQMLQNIQKDISELKIQRKEILNVNEACHFLSLSTSHLYKLTSTNQIPHFQPNGKKLYFKRSELEEWLSRNRKGTVEEIEVLAANYILSNQIRKGGA